MPAKAAQVVVMPLRQIEVNPPLGMIDNSLQRVWHCVEEEIKPPIGVMGLEHYFRVAGTLGQRPAKVAGFNRLRTIPAKEINLMQSPEGLKGSRIKGTRRL